MNNGKSPRRKGPGMSNEKPKNFNQALSRLFKELNVFKILIYIAIILAILSSILSIFTPNKLSDLTDQIQKGLVVRTKNLKTVTTGITNNINEKRLKDLIPKILDFKLDDEKVEMIFNSKDVSENDKILFRKILEENDLKNFDNFLLNISNVPKSVQKLILPNTKYEKYLISTEDKILFINEIYKIKQKKYSKINFPGNISKIIFTPFSIDNIEISSQDQKRFLELSSNLNEKSNSKDLYKIIDKMPNNIQKIVKPYMSMDKIKFITFFLIILYLLSALFNYVQAIIMTIVSNKFANKLRKRISKKINKLPLKYFDMHQYGDILSRVTNDVDTIAQSLNQSLSSFVSSLTLFFGTIIMMFYTNWILASTAILSSLIGFIFMSLILSKSQKYFVSRQVELGKLNGHIEEIYSGLNVVKVYNGKKDSDKKFDEFNEKVYEANRKSQFLSGLMMPLMSFIGNFGYVCVCIVGALLTMNEMITFGTIIAFITYVRLFTSPLSQIAQSLTSLQTSSAASERVFEFLDEEEMNNQEKITKYLDPKKVKGNIEFKDVCFKYDEKKEPVIKSFNAIAKSGQKIAIVGPTGAGKTTLVNLLMKFYEINSGNIKIDNISIKDLTRENIHELFTMVLQDTWLFDGTIKENIVYNRKDISDEQVKTVCKTVGLHHFIKTLPYGYNSKIADNDSVSAGQRQLLTIARAMLDSSPFLILDEATSNVDTRTEELVQNAMDKLTEGKTSFIIAHRLSTIKNADLILVLNNGDIIEQGNHDELMNKKGFYADLYNSQFKL